MASNMTQHGAPALVSILTTLLVTGFICACSTVSVHTSSDVRPLSGHEIPPFQADDLTQVSEEMKDFLQLHVPPTMSRRQRIWKLAYILTDPYVLQFDYEPELTLPPAETFRRRTGNCLSFSLMLVAMAHHAGVPAHFQEVIVAPEYRSVNDTFVNSRHINVVLGDRENKFIVDVSRRIIDDDVRTRIIPEQEAIAQYYNNLGVEAILTNDLSTAWGRFRQALLTDSNAAYLWSNLGVVYNRNSQVDDAEWAYQTALSADGSKSMAVNNLYVIYQQEGRWQEAARLEPRVMRHRKRNPYYLAMLADEAQRSRQYDDAISLLKKSIRINNEEYRFHGALAQAQYLAGDHEDALSSLDAARALAPPTAAEELKFLPLGDLPD